MALLPSRKGNFSSHQKNSTLSLIHSFYTFLVIASVVITNVSVSADDVNPYTTRLPTSLKPTKYVVKIRPVLEDSDVFQQWTNNGDVLVSFTVVTETDTITLHAYNLTVLQADVVLKDSKNMEVKIKSQDQNEKHQTHTVITESPMKAGESFTIFLPFIGIMLGKDVGLYGFTYPDESGNNAKMAVATQSQPFHTREIFPCFDEPHFKAIFAISIARLEKYQTFSNMKIKESKPDPVEKEWVWDEYEETPVMSTNLVSIIVVDDYTSVIPSDPSLSPKIKIQVWAPKLISDMKSTQYAADQTAKMLNFFQEYFDYPYPLDKLDSVLIFESEGPAVEHWGSITYGMGGSSLLYYPGKTPEWKRFNTISLISHEVVHSWMGNLISCEWFSDIWIHEGFADFFADEAVSKLQPEFTAEVLFINSHFQRALRADQSYKSHPVKHMFKMSKVQEGEEEETDAFDEIAYSKGASLVKMMKNFMGEADFKEGLRMFLKKFAYKSVNQGDLFDTLNSVHSAKLPGATFKQIMDTWTLQSGFPLVRVNVEGPNSVQIIQEKFKIGMDNEDTSDPRWWIPIKMVSAAKPMLPPNSPPNFWIPDTTRMMSYSTDIDTSKWLIVNPDATGFFRVMYDKQLRMLIKEQLDKDHTVFSPITRSQILDDYFTFASYNYVPLEETLELTTYLHKELELVVWTVVFTHLKTAMNMFNSNGEFTGLQKYLLPKIDAVLKSPGVTVEIDQESKGNVVLFRSELLQYGCMLKSPVCHKYVTELMNTWRALEQTNPIPLDLQPTLYCAGVAAGDKGTWDFVKKLHDQMPPSEQKMFLFKALSCSSDPAVLGLFLESGWQTPTPVLYLEALAENPQGKFLVFESIKTNLKKLKPEEFIRVLNILSEYWIDPDMIKELENFVQANSKFFESNTEELIEEIESHKANAAWMAAVGRQMNTWFTANAV